ncbi:MAG: DUF2971 domain-containing protein [Bacteroidales bacterium]|nr:DUF2971 domain-containing protein [Bacteroidales bacterium]
MNTLSYRNVLKDILESTILPEGISIEERETKLLPLSNHISEHLPSRLFRYRNCSNKNIGAFKEDLLYAVTSDMFNDPYDCLFRFNQKMLRDSIMNGLSKDVLYAIREQLRAGGDFPNVLKDYFEKDFLDYAKENFLAAKDDELNRVSKDAKTIKSLLDAIINKVTEESVQSVKKMTFISCFSEVVDSVIMWSHYANSHKGFALEYDAKIFRPQCFNCNNLKHCDKAVTCNLFPVIYHKQRYEATDFIGWCIGREMGLPIKNPDTFAIFKTLLFKSPQWSYEKEWRLIVCKVNDFQNKSPVCINNLRPKAIYYGTEISAIHKKKLHLIAKKKGIKEYQMYIDNNSSHYSLKAQKI